MALPTPFLRPTFCGASVLKFGTNIGWNEQSSQHTVHVVEDPANGDLFNPPPVGTPIYFQFYGNKFFGILQKWNRIEDVSNLPAYELICTDPRDLLEGTKVIVRDYLGTTGGVANLLNTYGFCENINGFGSSLVNEAGMPWYLVVSSITSLCNSPAYGPFGGPITFRGVSYGLDLSELPVPPPYYRIGATDSLLTMISQVCQDGGVDFFVQLDGFTIRIRTVSRYNQPPLGTIDAVANQDYGATLSSSRSGLEMRNETTASFLVGGQQYNLFTADPTSIQPFFGLDPFGTPITSSNGYDDASVANLNALEISDILGGAVYPCSIKEMRCALLSPDLWQAYISSQRPDIATIIGYNGVYGNAVQTALQGNNAPAQLGKFPIDFFNDNPANASGLAAAMSAGLDGPTLALLGVRGARLYTFVQSVSQTFLGRKFLVNIPFVLWKQEPDTLKITLSQEPAGEGGYMPDGSQPLGLNPLNEDYFTNEDGRFRCFALYNAFGAQAIDTTTLRGGSDGSDFIVQPSPALTPTFIDNPVLSFPSGVTASGGFPVSVTYNTVPFVANANAVYVQSEVDPHVYFTPAPAVVVSVRNPLFMPPIDIFGDINAVSSALGANPSGLQNAVQMRVGGALNLGIFPSPIQPDYLAVPLKSNILTYGPWYLQGAPGKVEFNFDQSLSPWQYGSIANMNAAAIAKVSTAITFMQVGETGSLEFAGSPQNSIGDTLQQGGPEITNVQVSYGKEGVKTNYEFKTWTPKFGLLGKVNADRIKRMGTTSMELRKMVRQLQRISIAGDILAQGVSAGGAFNNWLFNRLRVFNPHSPHPVLGAYIGADGNSGYRIASSSLPVDEAIVAANANNSSLYKTTALMSLEGLLRPFSTYYNAGLAGSGLNPYASGISPYVQPSGLLADITINSKTYNPFFEATDFQCLAWGDSYQGMLAYKRGGFDTTNTRALALRGPLLMSGWGYGIDGQFYPNNTNYGKRSDLWPTGPVDHLWDPFRGCWTSHDALLAVLPSGQTLPCQVRIYTGDTDTGIRLTAYNFFQTPLTAPSGCDLRIILNYIVTANRWYVVAADCGCPTQELLGGLGGSVG